MGEARSAYGRGARGTAWLYIPCLVGIRLIERSLGDVDAEEGQGEATTGSEGDAVEDEIKPSQPAATGTKRKAKDKGSSSKRKRVTRKK
jgi:hypothetical protein